MSFLKPLFDSGRAEMTEGVMGFAPVARAVQTANPMMQGLDKLIGAPGNYLQMLDPQILQALIQRFGEKNQGSWEGMY